MKNIKRMLGISGVSLLLLASCGNTDEVATTDINREENEITVWSWDPNFNIAALKIAEEYYKEDNPDFSLNIVENAHEDIVQQLNTSLSSGVETGLPNIVFIEDYRAPNFLSSYEGAFYSVDEYYNTDDFADSKITAGTYNNKVYNVPFDSAVTGLYVRTDYLEEAGYTLEDLEDLTWSEYIEIGKDVHEKTGVSWITNDTNDAGILRYMLHSSGSWYTEDDGVTPNIQNNESLALAFEDIKTMIDTGIMNTHNEWDQFMQTIHSGSVVTVPHGNWISASIMQEESQSGNWGIVSIPRQDLEGSVNASNQGGSSIYVLNVEGKELAAEFLADTFGSNVDFYQDLIYEISAVGAYEPAYKSEAYEYESEFYGNQQIYQDLGEWTQEVPKVNFGKRTLEIENILMVALQDYLGGSNLENVLENAQNQAESAM